MQPLAVDLRLFTESGSSALRLNPGRGLMARVMVADGTGRGVLNIAGAVIEAELPRQVRTGEQVRLIVRHLDNQRVVLELDHGDGAARHAPDSQAARSAPEAQAAPQPPPLAVPLPGGGQISVPDEAPEPGRRGSSAPGSQTVAVRYDAPALGALDLHFELHPSGLQVTVTAAAGAPFELAHSQAPALREALAASAERPVSVTVTPRRQPLDLYA